VQISVTQELVTVIVANENGTQLGPKLTLANNQPSPIITALNQIGTGNSLILTTLTVQFGHTAHLAHDEEK
jgi:hypothetical protein